MSKLTCTLLTLWLSVVGTGIGILWNYGQTPGVDGTPPLQWPSDSLVQRASDKPTLVMFAHPHCPCTRASLRELSLLMTRCRGLVAAHVLFVKPGSMPENWEKTDLWDEASAIPGVEVVRDNGGDGARRFGIATSGQTVLYNSEGRLLFSGGITATRGHSGDNAGRSTIVSLLSREETPRRGSPVFGCSLLTPSSN